MTKHEIEILDVMRSRGKTAMDIALTLQISVNTVRSYIRRTRRRMPSGSNAASAESPFSK